MLHSLYLAGREGELEEYNTGLSFVDIFARSYLRPGSTV
jgi:hypothetical protein